MHHRATLLTLAVATLQDRLSAPAWPCHVRLHTAPRAQSKGPRHGPLLARVQNDVRLEGFRILPGYTVVLMSSGHERSMAP